jgi:FkbM family methyltransferase
MGERVNRRQRIAVRTANTLTAVGSKFLVSEWSFRVAAVAEQILRGMQGKSSGVDTVVAEVEAVAKLVPHDAVLVDVGANQGKWTRAALERFKGRQLKIFAFEPSSFHAAKLGALRSEHVEVIHAAVGALPGTATLYSEEPGSGRASLYERVGEPQETVEGVSVITLDDFFEQRRIGRIDLMKMDIEGHELAALQGARASLASERIRALTFEFGESNLNSRTFFRDFWNLLTGFGFAIFRIVPGKWLLPIRRYSRELEDFTGVGNYVAVKRSG